MEKNNFYSRLEEFRKDWEARKKAESKAEKPKSSLQQNAAPAPAPAAKKQRNRPKKQD